MRWTLSDVQIRKLQERLSVRDLEILKRMSDGWEMVVSPAGLVRLCHMDVMEFPHINRIRELEKKRLIECNAIWKQPAPGERGGWQDVRGFVYVLSPSGEKLTQMPHDVIHINNLKRAG